MRILFLLPLLFLILTISQSLPTWGTYNPSHLFSLLNTNTSQTIQFSLISFSSSLTTFTHQVPKSTYLFHDGHNYFQKLIETNQNGSVLIKGEIGHKFNVTMEIKNVKKVVILFSNRDKIVVERKKEVFVNDDLKITTKDSEENWKWCNLKNIELFDFIENTQPGNSLLFTFTSFANTSTINFHNKIQKSKQSDKAYKESFLAKQNNFIKHYQLNSSYNNIITHALANTIGSISFRRTSRNQYFELKSKYSQQQDKPNIGLSTLTIDLLSHFDKQIHTQLFNSLIQRLQDDSIYSLDSNLFTMPEHTDIFLRHPNPKSIKILSSIIYRNLFHKVNHVIGHQSADYHSSKQLHPILKKLLQISWESNYNFLKSNSIYTESFLSDAYIHSQEEEMQLSVSKTTWLLKTIRILIELNKNNQDGSMQQLKTLQNNLRQYFKSTCYSKQEKLFKSISSVERSRYYSRVVGYQSFLPFVYKIEPKYQQSYSSIFKIMRNVTTERGIASQQNSDFTNMQEYLFRGRIWAYFNYKIVQMFETPQNMMEEYIAKDVYAKGHENVEQMLGEITRLLRKIEGVEKKSAEVVREGVKQQILKDWERKGELFASWSVIGEPLNDSSQIILVNTLFLK